MFPSQRAGMRWGAACALAAAAFGSVPAAHADVPDADREHAGRLVVHRGDGDELIFQGDGDELIR